MVFYQKHDGHRSSSNRNRGACDRHLSGENPSVKRSVLHWLGITSPRAPIIVFVYMFAIQPMSLQGQSSQSHNEGGILEPERVQHIDTIYNILTGVTALEFNDFVLGPNDAPSSIAVTRTFRPDLISPGIGEEGMDARFGFGTTNSLDITWFCSGSWMNNCDGLTNDGQGQLILGGRSVNFNGSYFGSDATPYERLYSAQGDGTYIKYDGDWSNAGWNLSNANRGYHKMTAITREGIQYLFSERQGNQTLLTQHGVRSIRIDPQFADRDPRIGIDVAQVIFANGEKLNFFYSHGASGYNTQTEPKVVRVENSRGYGIRVKYMQGTGVHDTRIRTKIEEIELYLNRCLIQCSEVILGQVSYSYSDTSDPISGKFYLDEFTDILGRKFEYNYSLYAMISAKAPDGSQLWSFSGSMYSPTVRLGDGDAVFEVQYVTNRSGSRFSPYFREAIYADGSKVIYTIKEKPHTENIWPDHTWVNAAYKTYHTVEIKETETHPQSGTGIDLYTADEEPRIIAIRDQLGRETKYEYDKLGRAITIEYPEGNMVHMKRDERGNIFERIERAKPGSGREDLVTKASFPACNDYNFRICNKPIYVIDSGGNRTNYTWSAIHGGLLTQSSGYDDGGSCALPGGCTLIEFIYSPFTGVDGATFYLATERRERINATQTQTTTYDYDTGNGFTLREKVQVADGVSLRTCYKHDAFGRRISETQPNANLASCQ